MDSARTLNDGLVTHGARAESVPALVSAFASLVDEGGGALVRVSFQLPSLHPEVAVQMFVWRPSFRPFELREGAVILGRERAHSEYGTVEAFELAYDAYDTPAFRRSPIYPILLEGRAEVVCPIDVGADTHAYPILGDLAADGGTGYVALALPFSGARGACSVATRKPGGFTPEDVDRLRASMPVLALCLERHVTRRVSEVLLETYVGSRAGRRVLQGRIRRGDVERMHAAIWFSDVRSFTASCERVGADTVIHWLNEYFDAVVAPIERQGGEVLKFIGDAVLAVFPCEQAGEADACRRALEAARLANDALDMLNARREAAGVPPLDHGVGLHVGEVMYGNIGGRRRLDFTVIGTAVNTASRIEGLSSRLGRRLVVSRAVFDHAPSGLARLGAFDLKGIADAQDVYGVVPSAGTEDPTEA